MLCRICGASSDTTLLAKEMMLGLKDEFVYFECIDCGCVQISEYPQDIGRYYGEQYYSFRTYGEIENGPGIISRGKRLLKHAGLTSFPSVRRRYLGSVGTQNWFGADPFLGPLVRLYLDRLDSPGARILDVGCGSGALLKMLFDLYYLNTFGVDPFISKDLYYRGRVLVRRASIYDVEGAFECVSLHHVLEHMPDQRRVLDAARRLLAPGGFILIRIPIAGTYAWRTYRENWVQLDPPRHFYLHSRKSIEKLAKSSGLVIESIWYDSIGFQLWGSELYCRNIPLTDPRSPWIGGMSVFTKVELESFEARAAALNALEDGDQVVLVMRRA